MNPRRLPAGLLPAIVLFASGTAGWVCAQEPPEKEMFRASTEVSSILVPVTVRDRQGRLVATLAQDRFHLYVDDMEFPIRSFWREGGLPISYSFVVDTSGSMNGRRLAKTREAIMEFVHEFRPGDEACLITFGAGAVKRRLPFGTDPGLLSRILESLRGWGTTALYDMLTATPQAMEGAHNMRRVVLLFTDGVDTASAFTPADAMRVLEGLADPVYALGIEPPPPEEGVPESYEDLLEKFAAASGGRYLRVDDASKLPKFARALRAELAMRYIITFDPSGVGLVKWRKVEVKVDGGYLAMARQGYRGTLP
jgi:VWFA-related protein